MTTLENLYNGNIRPCELPRLQERTEYKEAIALVCTAQEKLEAALTDEQKMLLQNYITEADKMSLITEAEIFKAGFSLAIKILLECM